MTDHERLLAQTAVFHASHLPLEIVEIPVPTLRPGEILVRNTCTTLCRSDLNTFIGKRQEKVPTILGHEIVGRIAAFGPDALTHDQRGRELREGDPVTWAIFASDPNSELSQRGIPQKGEGLYKYGHEQLTDTNTLHGGLSRYTILHPHTPIARLEEAVPLPVAAIINCAVATVAGALRQAGTIAHRNILISGTGMLGLIACAMAKIGGANQVIAVDVSDERLMMARRFGADSCMRADTDYASELAAQFGKPNAVDVVIELSGTASAMEYTLRVLGIGGTAVWVGATFPLGNVRVDPEKIVRNLHSIRGLHNYNTQDFITAVEFIEQYHLRFPFTELIYDQFDLAHANEAFAYALTHNPFRVGIRF